MTTDVWLALIAVAFLLGGVSTALVIHRLLVREALRQFRRRWLDDQ